MNSLLLCHRMAFAIIGSLALTPFLAAQTGSGPAPAAGTTTPASTVTLRYLEVKQPTELKFKFQNQEAKKPVGAMAFDYPAGSFPVQGIAPGISTFCVEALVPIYAGNVYTFSIDAIDRPEFFGLPDTEAGRVEAVKRAGYVRELYGRFYQDTITQPELGNAAFQTALWEVIQERELAQGPSPFNLFTGAFRASYPNEMEAPSFVQQAQRYVLALTGDETKFLSNPATMGQELVRLTGLATANSPAPQSQLALRGPTDTTTPTSDSGPGGAAPILGISQMLPTGIPLGSGMGGLGAPGRGGPAGPAAGLGGGGGGFPFLGGAGGSNPRTNDTNPTSSPQGTNLPLTLLNSNLPSNFGASSSEPVSAAQQQPDNGGPILPLAPTPPDGSNTPTANDPDGNKPGGQTPDGNTPQDNNPVPAPPALVLGLIGIGVVTARRWLKFRTQAI